MGRSWHGFNSWSHVHPEVEAARLQHAVERWVGCNPRVADDQSWGVLGQYGKQYEAIRVWNIVGNYGIWWNMMEYDGIWWNMMEYDGIWWKNGSKSLGSKPINLHCQWVWLNTGAVGNTNMESQYQGKMITSGSEVSGASSFSILVTWLWTMAWLQACTAWFLCFIISNSELFWHFVMFLQFSFDMFPCLGAFT